MRAASAASGVFGAKATGANSGAIVRDTAGQSGKVDRSTSGSGRKRAGASPGRSGCLGSGEATVSSWSPPTRASLASLTFASAFHLTSVPAGHSTRTRAKPMSVWSGSSRAEDCIWPFSTGSLCVTE